MNRRLALVLALLLAIPGAFALADSAAPNFVFDTPVAVGFQGREAMVRLKLRNPVSVGRAVMAQLRDEEGTVLGEAKFSSKSVKGIQFTVPNDWLGAKRLSVWVEDVKVSEDDLFFAADDLGNKSLRKISTSMPHLSITIDAAWGDVFTLELLEILDEFDVKCTFFVTGFWAYTYPHHIAEIIRRGHEVGNHSYTHPRLTQKSLNVILSELVRTSDEVEAAGGKRPVLFRPPFGDSSEKLRALSRSVGCELVMWTVDSHDWDYKNYDKDRIIKRVTKDVGPGSIILFHNDGPHTRAVLREVIPYWQSLGLELVPVSAMLSEGSYRVNAEGVAEFLP